MTRSLTPNMAALSALMFAGTYPIPSGPLDFLGSPVEFRLPKGEVPKREYRPPRKNQRPRRKRALR